MQPEDELPFDPDTMVLRLFGKTVYRHQIEAAESYLAQLDAGKPTKLNLELELTKRELFAINDGLIFEAIIDHQKEFESAVGSRSGDAESHASVLKFLVQVMRQLRTLTEQQSKGK